MNECRVPVIQPANEQLAPAPCAALQQQEVTTLEQRAGSRATARSRSVRPAYAHTDTHFGLVTPTTDRHNAAEKRQHRGRGETHGPGVSLLHDRAARSRRGSGCDRDRVGAGGVRHLPDREGEEEEGRRR